jgi:tRNA threonylcarbamoyladenosine biosynthesis protein TsaB
MNILALDTATPAPAVALLCGGEVLEETLPTDRRLSEELFAAVARLLGHAGARMPDCHRFAACAGPGSFTGVRVGLGAAWGFAKALGAPFEPVSTLEAMAEGARRPGLARVVAVLDAGRGEIAAEGFDLSGPRARSLAPARRLAPERLPEIDGADLLVAVPSDLVAGAESPGSVARALALAVARSPREPGAPHAIYSRPSAAEEKWDSRPTR